MNSLDSLINSFAKLPGLGPRSAKRMVLHLIKNRNKLMRPLHDLFELVMENIVNCRICNNLDLTNPCALCLDNERDHSQICVVEEISDLWAIEKGGSYLGLYHVLGGALSALDGIGPDQLAISPLIARIEENIAIIDEIIIATNATIEGKTTSHYIIEKLKKYEIKISTLPYGIPVGGEIDYLDEHTLSAAMSSRKFIEERVS